MYAAPGEDAAEEFRRVMKVGCTGCQYCMPCPAGVNIPSCFECYNSKHAFKDKRAKMMYLFQNGGLVTAKPTMASMCVECGQCLEKCPQHLPIPDLLKDVQADMEGFMTRPMIWLGKRVMKVRKKKNKSRMFQRDQAIRKVKSNSRLDRLFRHAENIRKQDNFGDDFTIVEVAFG
jgi:L-lactate utilization protein LutB